MRIMVCFDGSGPARAVLPVARAIAATAGADVHLVRVAPHDLSASGVPWSGSNAVDIEKHRRAEEQDLALWTALEAVAAEFGVPVRVAVLGGHRVADELIRYARAEAIDLIVVGCRERGPMHPGVGGGVTHRLVQSKVAPVLLGPMVSTAHLDVRSVPLGCAVFSHDGYYVGDLAQLAGERMRISRHAAGDLWFSIDDAAELSMASGLRLGFDAADLGRHEVVVGSN